MADAPTGPADRAFSAASRAADMDTISQLREMGARRVKVGDIEVEFFGPALVPDILADGSRPNRNSEANEETLEDFTKDYFRDALRSST